MLVDLNKTEAEVLERIVTRYLEELAYEIANTDLSSFKSQLRLEREMVTEILGKLAPYAERAWV